MRRGARESFLFDEEEGAGFGWIWKIWLSLLFGFLVGRRDGWMEGFEIDVRVRLVIVIETESFLEPLMEMRVHGMWFCTVVSSRLPLQHEASITVTGASITGRKGSLPLLPFFHVSSSILLFESESSVHERRSLLDPEVRRRTPALGK